MWRTYAPKPMYYSSLPYFTDFRWLETSAVKSTHYSFSYVVRTRVTNHSVGSALLEGNPFRFVIVLSTKSAKQGGLWGGKVFLGDSDPARKPRRPPAVRANCNDGVVAKRCDRHVFCRPLSDRIDHVISDHITPTPLHVPTQHDK